VKPLVVSRLVRLWLLVVLLLLELLRLSVVRLFVVGLLRKELLMVSIPTADTGTDTAAVYGRICFVGESLRVVAVVRFRLPASHRM